MSLEFGRSSSAFFLCTCNQGLSMGVKANPPLLLHIFAATALGRDTTEPELKPDLKKDSNDLFCEFTFACLLLSYSLNTRSLLEIVSMRKILLLFCSYYNESVRI